MRNWLVATATGTALVAGASSSWRLGSPLGRAVMLAQAAPSGAIDIYNSGFPIERGACLAVHLGSSAAAECGNLRVVHDLPSVRVFNTNITPRLIYNSHFAHPYMTLPIRVTQLSTTTTPDSVEVQVRVGPLGDVRTLRTTKRWAGSEWTSGQTSTRRITVVYDAINDATGAYLYELTIANIYPGGVRVEQATKPVGSRWVVNRSNSPFGAGWWLEGLEQVMPIWAPPGDTQHLWIGGDGSTRVFVQGYANGYDRLDSLQWVPGSQIFIRRLPEGRRVEFDAAGRHVRTINRFGRITQFTHSGTLLQSISLPSPTGKSYDFGYTATKLNMVTAPPVNVAGDRIANVIITSGKLMSITNPGDSVVRFTYLSAVPHEYLLQQRTNRRGIPTAFTYDSALKIRTSSVTPGFGAGVITTTVIAGESRGLAGSGSPSSVDTTKVYAKIDGPRPGSVGDTTMVFQENYGSPRRAVEPGNAVTHLRRVYVPSPGPNDEGWVLARVKRPLGQVVQLSYEDRGNVIMMVDSTGTLPGVRDTTLYQWDQSFDQLQRIIPPEKDSITFQVNATNGRRDWQEDARGLSSRVNFAYDPTYAEQVTSMLLPDVGSSSALYTYGYDAVLRNTATQQTPQGYVTRDSADAIGRVVLAESPIDSTLASTRKLRKFTLYNLRGEIVTDSTGTLNDTLTQAAVARSFYNPEGQVDSGSAGRLLRLAAGLTK